MVPILGLPVLEMVPMDGSIFLQLYGLQLILSFYASMQRTAYGCSLVAYVLYDAICPLDGIGCYWLSGHLAIWAISSYPYIWTS